MAIEQRTSESRARGGAPRAFGIFTLIALSLLASAALSQPALRVALLSPKADDPDSVDAAAELGLALERALHRTAGFTQVGRTLSADELLAAFGCLEVDETCAAQVGRTTGADEILQATIRSHRGGFEVHLARRKTVGDVVVTQTRWRVLGGRDLGRRDDVLSPVAQGLARWILSDAPRHQGAVLALSPDRAPAQIDGRPAPSGQVLSLPTGIHEIAAAGRPAEVVKIRPGELMVVDLPTALGEVEPARTGLSSRRLGAWVTLGLGVAAGLGAGYAASEMGDTQDRFDRGGDRQTLEDLASRGNNLEITANGLMVLTVLSLGASTWLFLGEE